MKTGNDYLINLPLDTGSSFPWNLPANGESKVVYPWASLQGAGEEEDAENVPVRVIWR